ncbi:GFA family protein [Sphingosinicella sp. LHD-64]|uniref:GFA family protein n=1 Tax=Sphingosinicella sp. LHD-64 TaxID=3072139 RepID=UPI00280CB471|nr:GFA family protein [Sphingosinicella sp. LHD-64]MDQ8757310.1 GFA family protein [Sphingosinicella sp. LHD-64]
MPLTGSCHCGATKFETDLRPEIVTRCTCSFCAKRGALWIYARPDQFRLLTPVAAGRLYSPTNPENRHYFCSTCGCATFSETPDWSEPGRRRIAISAHLLDEIDIHGLPVEVLDGRNLW